MLLERNIGKFIKEKDSFRNESRSRTQKLTSGTGPKTKEKKTNDTLAQTEDELLLKTDISKSLIDGLVIVLFLIIYFL